MTEDFGPLVRNLLVLTNIFHSVKIDKLVVPELVEITSSDLVLDCQYTVPDDNFTIRWLLNNVTVYEWSPQTKPIVHGVLHGLIDLTFQVSDKPNEEYRALRFIQLTPELNGNYTCRLDSYGVTVSQTKHMLIYSFEREFDLITRRNNNSSFEVFCTVRGVYPRPDLTIEFNKVAVSGQWQRVWRNDSLLYDARCHARIKQKLVSNIDVVCRLYIPDVDYTAIKKKIIAPNNILDTVSRGSESHWQLRRFYTCYAILHIYLFNRL